MKTISLRLSDTFFPILQEPKNVQIRPLILYTLILSLFVSIIGLNVHAAYSQFCDQIFASSPVSLRDAKSLLEATKLSVGSDSPIERAISLKAKWLSLQKIASMSKAFIGTDGRKENIQRRIMSIQAEMNRLLLDLRDFEQQEKTSTHEVSALLNSQQKRQLEILDDTNDDASKLKMAIESSSSALVGLSNSRQVYLDYYLYFRNILDFELPKMKYVYLGYLGNLNEEIYGRGSQAFSTVPKESVLEFKIKHGLNRPKGGPTSSRLHLSLTKNRLQQYSALNMTQRLNLAKAQQTLFEPWYDILRDFSEVEKITSESANKIEGRPIHLFHFPDYRSRNWNGRIEALTNDKILLKSLDGKDKLLLNFATLKKMQTQSALGEGIEKLIQKDQGVLIFYKLNSTDYAKITQLRRNAKWSADDYFPGFISGIEIGSEIRIFVHTLENSLGEWINFDEREIVFPRDLQVKTGKGSIVIGNQDAHELGQVFNIDGSTATLYSLGLSNYFVGTETDLRARMTSAQKDLAIPLYQSRFHQNLTLPDYIEKARYQAEPHGQHLRRVEDLISLTTLLQDFYISKFESLNGIVEKKGKGFFQVAKNLFNGETLKANNFKYLNDMHSSFLDIQSLLAENEKLSNELKSEIALAIQSYKEQHQKLQELAKGPNLAKSYLEKFFNQRMTIYLPELLIKLTEQSNQIVKLYQAVGEQINRCMALLPEGQQFAYTDYWTRTHFRSSYVNGEPVHHTKKLMDQQFSSKLHELINYSKKELAEQYPSDRTLFPHWAQAISEIKKLRDFEKDSATELFLEVPIFEKGSFSATPISIRKVEDNRIAVQGVRPTYWHSLENENSATYTNIIDGLKTRLSSLLLQETINLLEKNQAIYDRYNDNLIVQVDFENKSLYCLNRDGSMSERYFHHTPNYVSDKQLDESTYIGFKRDRKLLMKVDTIGVDLEGRLVGLVNQPNWNTKYNSKFKMYEGVLESAGINYDSWENGFVKLAIKKKGEKLPGLEAKVGDHFFYYYPKFVGDFEKIDFPISDPVALRNVKTAYAHEVIILGETEDNLILVQKLHTVRNDSVFHLISPKTLMKDYQKKIPRDDPRYQELLKKFPGVAFYGALQLQENGGNAILGLTERLPLYQDVYLIPGTKRTEAIK